MAGTMSVPRSIQRMVMVPSGSGTSAMMKSRNGEISGMLLVRVYAIDFLRLSKIRRPSQRTQTVGRGHMSMYVCMYVISHVIKIGGVQPVIYKSRTIFGRPFVKRFALCYRIVVCLSVCPVLFCL